MAEPGRAAAIPARRWHGPAPLTAAQSRLWIMHQLDPASPISNRPLALRLAGPLDPSVLEAALTEIVRRHEALRTVFGESAAGPVQIVQPPAVVALAITGLGHLPADRRERAAREIATQGAREPFDLAHGPLLRARLLELGADDHVLLTFMHHIVFDGWSEALLTGELRTLYGDLSAGRAPSLPPPAIQPRDFAAWQRERLSGSRLERDLRYWRAKLADRPAVLELPTDAPRPPELVRRGRRVSLTLGSRLTAALREHSRRRRVTLFMTLLAGFQILLARCARQTDIVVGAPIAGRARPETEVLIGCFMNTLVLRTDLSGDPTFDEVLVRVRDTALEAYAHQEVPFERLVEELRPARQPNRWPLAQVMFTLRNLPAGPRPHLAGASPPGGLTVRPFEFDPGLIGGLDLSLEARPVDDDLRLTFNYATELFRGETIEGLGRQLRRLLGAAMHDPDRAAARLALMGPDERRRVLAQAAGPRLALPAGRRVHDLFEAQARRAPADVALEDGCRQLTYAELDRRASELAERVRALVGPAGAPVAVCGDRCAENVIAFLAVLRAGAAYLPIDPANPPARRRLMLEDSQPAAVIELGGGQLEIVPTGEARVGGAQVPRDVAYVMYTSGSTGTPKGVAVSHRALLNHLVWRRSHFPLRRDDRVLHRTAVGFDDSLWELLEPLLAGARLVIAPPGSERDPPALVRLLRERAITAACFVPSQLSALLEVPDLGRCRSLRRVTTGGEAVPVALAQRFLERVDAELHSGYGPTEATIAATFWRCRPGESGTTVPIGRPIANTEVHVLDEHLEPVPVGAAGELCIGGAGLAHGYVGRPELTAERFVRHPLRPMACSERLYRTGDLGRRRPDGVLEFLGRIDRQVKVRGQRVELGEIEAVLGGHPGVRECAVVQCQGEVGDRSLVAWVAGGNRSSSPPAGRDLRAYLTEQLPCAMVPARFGFVATMPVTASGKLDRGALVEMAPDVPRVRGAAPEGPTEIALARVWKTALGVQDVGRDDDFFDLGGHSLLAAQVAQRLATALVVEVSLRDVFEHPTLGELARAVDGRRDPAVARC